MGIDHSKLSGGKAKKLNALRTSVGNALAEEVFGKRLAQQATAPGPKPDAVGVKIGEAPAGFADDRSFRLGNDGYTIKRARGKGASGFAVTKNEQSR